MTRVTFDVTAEHFHGDLDEKKGRRALSRFADRKSISKFFKINCTSWDESFIRGEYAQPGNYSNCIATRLNVPLDCSLSLSLSSVVTLNEIPCRRKREIPLFKG